MSNCTIMAVSVARGISEDEAEEVLTQFGKPKGKGMPIHHFRPFIARQDWAEYLSVGKVRELSVREFCRRHKKGRYIVAVKGHVFAVVNGRPMDKSVNRHNRAVQNAWRVTRVPKGQGV